MSFKIFSLQLLGKIKPTEKIEQKRESLYNDYLEYQETEKSDELAEVLKLEEEINSTGFKNKKAEIQSLKFKGSKEYEQQQEFEKLKKAKHIKLYFKAKNSTELSRYNSLKDSEKLEEYHNLRSYIKDGDFKRDKEKIKSQKYKGSDEERKRKEFEKLKNSKEVKEYEKLPEKEKTAADNYNLKRYKELKPVIDSNDFRERENYLKDKKKLEKSEPWKKYKRYKELAASSDIKFAEKYGKSKIYRNYLNVKDSDDLKRYYELEKIISSKEFQERKAYLADTNKWEKSEESEKEKKYEEMKKRPRIEKYFKYKGTSAFQFFEEWEVSFEDNFTAPVLQADKWSVQSYVAQKLMDENYSMAGDLNIFTRGKNIQTGGNKLTIETKREKTEGKVWNLAAGFVPVELDYSSGLVSTGQSFWQEDGIFEAKIKFSPVKQVVSSVYLQGEQNSPRINLLEMGTKNRVGISTLDEKNKVSVNGLDISNLKKEKWYIFTLEKINNELTWKINETEILQENDSRFNFPLHLNASTLVVYEIPGSNLPVHFQVEWVRCYRKK